MAALFIKAYKTVETVIVNLISVLQFVNLR